MEHLPRKSSLPTWSSSQTSICGSSMVVTSSTTTSTIIFHTGCKLLGTTAVLNKCVSPSDVISTLAYGSDLPCPNNVTSLFMSPLASTSWTVSTPVGAVTVEQESNKLIIIHRVFTLWYYIHWIKKYDMLFDTDWLVTLTYEIREILALCKLNKRGWDRIRQYHRLLQVLRDDSAKNNVQSG